LILLSLIPVIAGAARLTELTGGAAITAQNARFFASPVPVVTHILSVTTYSLLGAFQFLPALRGRRGWHRIAGRILAPVGLLAALSGLWMAVFYPLPHGDGPALLVLRLVFGSAMAASIVLGVVAVVRRDFVRHGAWMTRGYAIGVAAGTQALTGLPWMLLVGPPDEPTRAVLLGAAWVINLAVAEYVIHRRARRTVRVPALVPVPAVVVPEPAAVVVVEPAAVVVVEPAAVVVEVAGSVPARRTLPAKRTVSGDVETGRLDSRA
jgi:hypothetical protein